MIGKQFLAAGNAIFTLTVPDDFASEHECQNRYTYRIVGLPGNDRFDPCWNINLLTGPENTRDYTYLGQLDVQTGQMRLTKKSRMGEDSWPVRLIRRVLAVAWEGREADMLEHGFVLMHAGRCGVCGRLLTVPESIETGIGPVCASK